MTGVTVVYGSRYGSTERYARWVAEDTGAQLVRLRDLTGGHLEATAAVAFLSPILAGSLMFRRALEHHTDRLARMPTAVVTVGLSPTDDALRHDHVVRAVPPALRDTVSVFHLRGAIRYERLDWLHRMMMGMVDGQARRAFRRDPSALNRRRAELAGVDHDFVDRATTAPLVGWLEQRGAAR